MSVGFCPPCNMLALLLLVVRLGSAERPKGTSYGYVPENGEITKYKADDRRDWRPFAFDSNANRTKSNDGPYYYEPPVYGPPFEDGVPPDPTIVPPSSDDFPSTPGYSYNVPDVPFDDLKPPQGDEPVPSYLPSDAPKSVGRSRNQFGANTPLQLEVNEMNCYDTPTDGRFQAVMTFKSTNENVPVFEDGTANEGCNIKSDTLPPRFNTRMKLNISKKDFQQCGIKDCSVDGNSELLCVRLRFPTVKRMRLPEDAVLTLQCRTRDKIAAHTKHLHFDVSNTAVGRSNGVVARGGGRGSLRSRAVLFRRGPRGDYSEALPSHARVPLGDTLMLRTDIEPGDGWASSRLSSISMRGGDQSEEIVLLQPDGCRTPQSTALCPKDPTTVSPLAQTLLIRAALFEGMRSGEEVRLSVRLVACLEANDCKTPSCQPSRTKRHTKDQMVNSTSILSFKVVVPQEEFVAHPRAGNAAMISMMMILTAAILSSAALIFLKTKGRMCS